MATAAFIFGLPAAPTAAFVVALGLVLLYLLWRDSSPVRALQQEVVELRRSLNDQAARHARDIAEVNLKMKALEDENMRQRSAKHKVTGDLAKTVIALDLVKNLAQRCTCGALHPLREIIDRLLDELDTLRHPPVEPL